MADWISFIDHLHVRKMYLIMDLTVGTMGNFIGFDGYLNSSTPFSLNEYNVEWLLPTYAPWGLDEYPDWKFSNGRFWLFLLMMRCHRIRGAGCG